MTQQPPTSDLSRANRPGGQTPSVDRGDRDTGGRPGAGRSRRPRLAYLVIGAIVVCAAIFALDALRERHRVNQTQHAQPATQADVHQQKLDIWRTRIALELDTADARTAQAINDSVVSFVYFMNERRRGSRAFAERMLSLRGKWVLVRSKMPGFLGGDQQAHLRYLNQQFSQLIFSDADLQKAIESAVVAYLSELQAAENDLLVKVRADMADIPLDAMPAAQSDEIFRNEFNRVARQIAPVVTRELGVDALREASSFVAGEVATTILASLATRMGASSGLMLAGAGSSWATFGLSIIAAVVIDQAISLVMDEVHDPVGQLEARIDLLLVNLCRLIISGDGELTGLKPQLTQFDRVRSRIRRGTLRQLILGENQVKSVATRCVPD